MWRCGTSWFPLLPMLDIIGNQNVKFLINATWAALQKASISILLARVENPTNPYIHLLYHKNITSACGLISSKLNVCSSSKPFTGISPRRILANILFCHISWLKFFMIVKTCNKLTADFGVNLLVA